MELDLENSIKQNYMAKTKFQFDDSASPPLDPDQNTVMLSCSLNKLSNLPCQLPVNYDSLINSITGQMEKKYFHCVCMS